MFGLKAPGQDRPNGATGYRFLVSDIRLIVYLVHFCMEVGS
jgi:hypothetical protein